MRLNKFEISETPTVEDTDEIITNGMKINKKSNTTFSKHTRVLKIMVGGVPFYHFNHKEFDSELATRKQDVVVGGKRFYMGLKNNSMHARLKLN